MRFFRDVRESFPKEKKNTSLPDEIIDNDGYNDLPKEIKLSEIKVPEINLQKL